MDLTNLDTLIKNSLRTLRERVAEGELHFAIQYLRRLIPGGPRELVDEVDLLSGRLARVDKAIRGGVLLSTEANAEQNRIALALLELLNDLTRKLPLPAESTDSLSVTSKDRIAEPEGLVGKNNLKQIAWVEQCILASRGVCRVLTDRAIGTGFLVAPTMLMTNNHLIPSVEAARRSQIEFNYQYRFTTERESGNVFRYSLSPQVFFRTGISLDYTLVSIQPAQDRPPISSWGPLKVNSTADPVPLENVVMIQHPNGGPKQIALTSSTVVDVAPPLLHYTTDTMAGSSGAPVFNDLWQVIAIHHAAGSSTSGARNSSNSFNEGVLMSAIRAEYGSDWPL